MRYEFPEFILDAHGRRLSRATSAEPVALTAKALDLLIYLVERRGEVLSRDQLLAALWPRVVVEENTLERQIHVLRKALGEGRGENRYIATVPGRGYAFIAAVHSTPDPSPGQAAPARPADTPDDPQRLLRVSRLALTASLALVVALALGVFLFSRHDRTTGTPTAAAPAPQASIAVLPFANLTNDPANRYLAEGLAEELIHRLARPGLKVPARTSSFAYGEQPEDVRRVAQELGVAYIIEGSVRGNEKNLRTTVQLIDASTGFHVWSQSYERPFSDTFALQDELAVAITQRVLPAGHTTMTTGYESGPPTLNLDAYRLFLQANALPGTSHAVLQEALAIYDRAVQLDPDFARALAARASTRILMMNIGIAPVDAIRQAERDARRALALDPTLSGAHGALGSVLMYRGHWLEAERAFEAARVARSPDPGILSSYTLMLGSVGRLQAAREVADEMLAAAPLSLSARIQQATILSMIGEDAAALEQLEAARALGAPQNLGISNLLAAQFAARDGRPAEAARTLLLALPLQARAAGAESVLTDVYAAWRNPGQRPAAAARLRELVATSSIETLDRRHGTMLMVLHAMVGDVDAAFAAANHAADAYAAVDAVGAPWSALWGAAMADVRRDRRFPALASKLRLTDYWKERGPPQACEGLEVITCR